MISALVVDKTVIVIAHRLQSICNADQIIVLEDGRVRESGNHEELIRANGTYKKLWDEPNKAGSGRYKIIHYNIETAALAQGCK
ncbi:MAG: hypothetical protein II273_07805 [Lachnospiraceae bacterium]|nr:hypothetical protein [Lachnospiraceae bacterium]